MFETFNKLFQLFYNVFHYYLLQRSFPIGNNACEANLIGKVIYAQKVDLPIQPNRAEREKEVLSAKHSKLNIDGAQTPHPNVIKENWSTKNEYLYQLSF